MDPFTLDDGTTAIVIALVASWDSVVKSELGTLRLHESRLRYALLLKRDVLQAGELDGGDA